MHLCRFRLAPPSLPSPNAKWHRAGLSWLVPFHFKIMIFSLFHGYYKCCILIGDPEIRNIITINHLYSRILQKELVQMTTEWFLLLIVCKNEEEKRKKQGRSSTCTEMRNECHSAEYKLSPNILQRNHPKGDPTLFLLWNRPRERSKLNAVHKKWRHAQSFRLKARSTNFNVLLRNRSIEMRKTSYL